MRRLLTILTTTVAVSLLLLAPAVAYDGALAQQYAEQFSAVTGAKAGKHLHLVKVDELVARVRRGDAVTMVDVRTPGETRFFATRLPQHRLIPLQQLFQPESLAHLPTDHDVVLLCASGVRATAAATALRHIGFERVYVLKGGYKALAAYLGPKEANQPLGPPTAAR